MSGGLHLEQYLENDENQENVAPAQILPDFSAYEFPRSLRSALTGLESLPAELQQNFHQMRDWDQDSIHIFRDIDKKSDSYLKEIRQLSDEERAEELGKILGMFSSAKNISEDKVQLAVQTYELVDKHIRRLDSDLAKFEAEVKEKPLLISKKEEEGPSKKKGRKKKEEVSAKGVTKKKKKGPSAAASDDEEENQQKTAGRKKKKATGKDTVAPVSGLKSVLPGLGGLSAIVHPSEAMDMPVDPNEPTYCLCHQVSYGEMIACDKSDCPIEWFHFACVSLTTKPKGKWYCPKCTTDIKKKK